MGRFLPNVFSEVSLLKSSHFSKQTSEKTLQKAWMVPEKQAPAAVAPPEAGLELGGLGKRGPKSLPQSGARK